MSLCGLNIKLHLEKKEGRRWLSSAIFYPLLGSLQCFLFISWPVNSLSVSISVILHLSFTPPPFIYFPPPFIHFFLLPCSYQHLSTESSSLHLSLIPLSVRFDHTGISFFQIPLLYIVFQALWFKIFPSSFSNDVGVEQQGASALLNMVKHREEKEVWKWVRGVWQSQIQRPGVARKCSVWGWRGVSVTAVVYVHDRFTVKTMTVDGVATIWLSVSLNERERANEITVVIHKCKRKCGSNMDLGLT